MTQVQHSTIYIRSYKWFSLGPFLTSQDNENDSEEGLEIMTTSLQVGMQSLFLFLRPNFLAKPQVPRMPAVLSVLLENFPTGCRSVCGFACSPMPGNLDHPAAGLARLLKEMLWFQKVEGKEAETTQKTEKKVVENVETCWNAPTNSCTHHLFQPKPKIRS